MTKIKQQAKPLFIVWVAASVLLTVVVGFIPLFTTAAVVILSIATWSCFRLPCFGNVFSYYVSISGFFILTLMAYAFSDHIFYGGDVLNNAFSILLSLNVVVVTIVPVVLWLAISVYVAVRRG